MLTQIILKCEIISPTRRKKRANITISFDLASQKIRLGEIDFEGVLTDEELKDFNLKRENYIWHAPTN